MDISPHAMGCCRERIGPSTRPRYLSGHKPGCHGIRGVPPYSYQCAELRWPALRGFALNAGGERRWRLVEGFHCCSVHAGSRQSGVCQDEGALCLRFRNHPGLMSMTETTHTLRDKRKAASFCSAWGLGRKGWPSAVQEVVGNLDASAVNSPVPWDDGVLRSMPAGPMSRIMLSPTETVWKDTDVTL